MALLRKLQRSNYRLLGLVGQGQFGQVYCAVHRPTGRLVALKNLNRDRLTTHRFLRELRFLLSLEHPNIANCHALEQSATGRQLVLDYCEGGTLRQLMEQGVALTLAEILTLITEVLAALDHAHSQGIVHCDIKPENILLFVVPGGWQAKISDFGIARLSQEMRDNDQTGATGSPAYMAPERFYRQHSASSDLYAVGVLLYELLVGERPFTGTPSQLMVAHLNQPPVIPAVLPDPLQSFLRKTLQKLVARRHRSAAAMKADLVAIRATLTATDLRTGYPPSSEDGEPTSFTPQGKQGIQVAPRQLQPVSPGGGWGQQGWLLAADHRPLVAGWSVSPQTQGILGSPNHWPLGRAPQALFAGPGRIMAATDQTLYELAPQGQVTQRVTWPQPVQVICCPSLAGAVGYSPEAGGHLWWASLKTANLMVRSLPLPPLPAPPVGLLLLDHRHLLLAVPVGNQTQFHIITRRGTALGHVCLNAAVTALALTRIPRRILAVEAGPKPGLFIIDLLPFRVMRCRLDVVTPWLGELALGYGCCSVEGRFRLVNPQGQLIGSVDRLPTPTAIAFQPPYHIWLATEEDGPSLQVIDVRKLDLDIIF